MKYFDSPFDKWYEEFCRKYNLKTKEEFDALLEKMFENMESDDNLNPEIPEGECFFCHKETSNWDFCYGCNHYVCVECIGPIELIPMGPHIVEQHKSNCN